MGMVGGLTQLTPEELVRLRKHPELRSDMEGEIAEADATRYCDLDKAWHGVHFLLVGDAGPRGTQRRRMWLLCLMLAGGFITLFSITRNSVVHVLALGSEVGGIAGLLYRLFALMVSLPLVIVIVSGFFWFKVRGVRWPTIMSSRGRMAQHPFVPPDAVRKVMLGGTRLGSVDDTSAYYATPEEVRSLAPMLAALSGEEIRRRFDATRMRALNIYIFGLAGHADESSFEYALDNLHRAVAFYQDAARRGNAVVFSYN